jgi:FixJ family two-component response regulator
MSPGLETPIIHVVDDDDSLRKALSRLLNAAGYEVRAYRSAGDFALAPRESRRGCILLDLQMPGPSGLELQEVLAREQDPLPIIFLTGHGSIPQSVRAMKAGAVDFLTKPVESELLLGAIRTALARDLAWQTTNEQVRELRARFETLTPREREVFHLVVAGKLNKQIAADLDMAERTVKAHRAQVMAKMEAPSLADLVHFADRMQL